MSHQLMGRGFLISQGSIMANKNYCGPMERFLKTRYAEAKTNQAKRIVEARNLKYPSEPFSAEDVLWVALSNGLDDMERRYCTVEPKPA
jgi:hypothetical protein